MSTELAARSTAEVLEQVLAVAKGLVVLTGGEPALQRVEAAVLSRGLRSKGHRVEVETNGSVPLGDLAAAVDLVVVSPKLQNSGVPLRHRYRPPVLLELSKSANAVFKFVVVDPLDLEEVDAVVHGLGLEPRRVWIMPEGTRQPELDRRMRLLAQPVAERGWSLSGRMHVTLWGDQRGR